MPIDPNRAIGSKLEPVEFSWSESDVLLYHLAVGAGADPTDPVELRYATEHNLQVLPTFGVVAPTVHETQPPAFTFPGIDIDLRNVLHGGQQIVAHRPLPTSGRARAIRRVVNVWDKGSAAVLVIDTDVCDLLGEPLWTARSSTFIRNEGGFGGERGPSHGADGPTANPDAEVVVSTLRQQALLYRLLGDRNPLHSDPESARSSGFSAPILHGLASFGIVCKALVDELLDGDTARVSSFQARFAGIVFPGEHLRTSAWRAEDRIFARTTITDRDDAIALSDIELTHT